MRAEAGAAGKGAAERVDVGAGTTGGAAAATGAAEAPETATVASDLSSEWEQAVPPMDS
jgi:hypothetical protein